MSRGNMTTRDVRNTIFESGTRLLIVVGSLVQQERRSFLSAGL